MERDARWRTRYAAVNVGPVSGVISKFRGRHPRGRGDRAVPAVHNRNLQVEGTHKMLRLQQPLDERYANADPEDLERRIAAAKATLGDRLFILGHHYQRDE
ncbi:MAG TPA: hypothetical protein VIR30_20385, partial [Nocardioides sp.]